MRAHLILVNRYRNTSFEVCWSYMRQYPPKRLVFLPPVVLEDFRNERNLREIHKLILRYQLLVSAVAPCAVVFTQYDSTESQ
jgi:hypothetical protein